MKPHSPEKKRAPKWLKFKAFGPGGTCPLESLAILICPVSVTFNIVLAKRAPKWLKFNAFRGSWSKSFKFQPLGSFFFQDYVVSR